MEFQSYFSKQRTSRYLKACGNDAARAMDLYKANLSAARSFHPLLSIVEVVLRNAIDNQLSYDFQDLDWIIHQKTGFMSHRSLSYIDNKTGVLTNNRILLAQVEKVERTLQKRFIKPSSGNLFSEQNFGFWTEFFEVPYFKILNGSPIKPFRYLPKGINRKIVFNELTQIRRFRNRISHNEPICFSGNQIDYSKAIEIYESILRILKWIDPRLVIWIMPVDQVMKEINLAKKI